MSCSGLYAGMSCCGCPRQPARSLPKGKVMADPLDQELLLAYVTSPDSVRKLYANITQLMLIALPYFAELDGEPPKEVFVGNCSVSMISPLRPSASRASTRPH